MVGVALNVIFVVVEVFYGVVANSLALITDAGHNLSDVMGLLLAWGASYLAGRQPSTRRTYGYSRATILASMFSSLLLLAALTERQAVPGPLCPAHTPGRRFDQENGHRPLFALAGSAAQGRAGG